MKYKNDEIKEGAKMKCTKCGHENIERANFCRGCGVPLIKKAPTGLDAISPKQQKKKQQVIPLFVIVLLSLTIVGMGIKIFVFPDEADLDDNSTKKIEQDLSASIDALLNRSESDGYIFLMNESKNVMLFEENEITKKIYHAIHYQIKKIEIDGSESSAQLLITSPDMYTILEGSIYGLNEDDVDKLLDIVNRALDTEYPKIESDVTVSLEQIGENWFLFPDSQLINALTGNLSQWYSQLGKNTVDALLKEVYDE